MLSSLDMQVTICRLTSGGPCADDMKQTLTWRHAQSLSACAASHELRAPAVLLTPDRHEVARGRVPSTHVSTEQVEHAAVCQL